MPVTRIRTKWASGNLTFYPVTDDVGEIDFGDGTNDCDVKVFLGTTAKYALFDVGNSRLELAGLELLFSGSPATHPIHFTGVTLPALGNAIRGIDVVPKRVSGWTCFTGTLPVSSALATVYSDYRELHTAGTDEVLGIGSFPFMDSGASCKSMFAAQFICEVDAGATVTTAAGAEGAGIFPLSAKCLINEATVNSGAVMAAIWASVQANVTDISGRRSDIMHMEVASGAIASVFYLKCSGGAGAANLFEFADDLGAPVSLTNGSILNDIKDVANTGWIRVKVGSTTKYIALYPETA